MPLGLLNWIPGLRRERNLNGVPVGPMGRAFGGYTPGPTGLYESYVDYISENDRSAFNDHVWGSRIPGLWNTRHLLQRSVQNDLQDQINQNTNSSIQERMQREGRDPSREGRTGAGRGGLLGYGDLRNIPAGGDQRLWRVTIKDI